MLGENIKKLRKKKNLSQEDLAEKLNVVRQTISKWEKGISVPDSQMLVRIADVLDVSVGEILREQADAEERNESADMLAAKLAEANEQIAKLNESRRKRLRLFWIIAAVIACVIIAFYLAVFLYHQYVMYRIDAMSIGIIGGADGPTSIVISSQLFSRFSQILAVLIPVGIAAAAFIGIHKTKR